MGANFDEVVVVKGPKVHRGVLLALLLACANGVLLPPSPAEGTDVMELEGRRLAITPAEERSLMALGAAVRGGRIAVQDAALKNARGAMRSRDARYAFALYELHIGGQRNDDGLRAQALDVLIASGLAPPEKLGNHLAVRGGIAYQLGDFKTARTHWTRLLEMTPNDPDVLANLAQVYQAENDPKGTAALMERAIAGRKASGKPISEIWYRQWMISAFNGSLVKPGIAAAHALVSNYPTLENWRYALVGYRQSVAPADGVEIDLYRLMRSVGVLTKADEHQRMAQLLMRSGMASEARAVIDEGVSRGILNEGGSPTREIIAEIDRALSKERGRLAAVQRQGATIAPAAQRLSVADTLVGIGSYAEAIQLYRAALEEGSVNAAELNIHLGTALVLAGRRAEAEAPFRLAATDTVPQSARYADLAQFWLAWLAQRPALPPKAL